MPTAQLEEHRYSTLDIESSSIVSQERLSFDSQLSTDVSLLDVSDRDAPAALDPDHSTLNVYEEDQSTVSVKDPILPNSSLRENDLELPRGWSTSPQPLKISLGSIIWSIIIDVVLLAVAVAFLAFAWSVVLYDQKPTDSHLEAAKRFKQASTWSPTVYPIVFASIVGRATHAIMLWGLETGQRIAVLDTLAGSTSLTSTVVSQFQLRRVSYVGLGLVAIWILSPVGGQSSFRQITFGPRNALENTTYLYVAPGPQMWVPDGGTTESNLNSIFTAALLSSATQESSPRDAWGHVKVPRVQYYEEMSPADDQGWYRTSNATGDTYSSLIGIPMSGIDSTDYIDYSATIEAMYFHMSCDPYAIPAGFRFPFNNNGSWFGNLSWNENTTERARMSAKDLEPFAFTWTWDHPEALNCTIETTYVEVAISCETYRTCSVPRIRRSHLEHPPLAYTLLGLDYRLNGTMWEQTINSSELFSRGYVNDPKDPRGGFAQSFQRRNNKTATRLGQMLNTYWAAMNGKNVFTSGMNEVTIWPDDRVSWEYQDTSQDMTEIPGTNGSKPIYKVSYDADSAYLARVWETSGTKCSSKEVFQAHWGWVVALMISSTVLITASLIPFYLRTFFLRGPDIIMNVSSLATRESTYLALPTTGTYLSASDRSRCLKDVRIAFRDVEKGSEIGRLALQQVEKVITPLRKGRKYV